VVLVLQQQAQAQEKHPVLIQLFQMMYPHLYLNLKALHWYQMMEDKVEIQKQSFFLEKIFVF
jgi:hypothetical protein